MSPATIASPPKYLLEQICWKFGSDFESLEDFETEVLWYQMDIVGHKNGWKPDEIVLPYREVRVHWGGLDHQTNKGIQKYKVVESASDKGFTALDLLYKVNQLMADDCKDMGYVPFKGFYRKKGPDNDTGIVEYGVAQGK
mmetsp:Transcript_11397/g.27490  ORF Transcript_11397/g.27490 Transcript_11397/m.27490 type:complete len:140 (-) Transcript_11397:1842-2261(-)